MSDVITGGRLVVPELFAARLPVAPVGLSSMKAKPVTADDFIVPARPDRNETPVIGVKPGLILTFRESAALPVSERGTLPDLDADVLKVTVIERHGRNGNIGRGFVKGSGSSAAPSPHRSATTATTSPSSARPTRTWP